MNKNNEDFAKIETDSHILHTNFHYQSVMQGFMLSKFYKYKSALKNKLFAKELLKRLSLLD
jgi:hypothetical protein